VETAQLPRIAPPVDRAAAGATVAAVSMLGVTKRFPGVVANDDVDFEAAAGEVHALLGENGAGKTTLSHVLTGLSQHPVVLKPVVLEIDGVWADGDRGAPAVKGVSLAEDLDEILALNDRAFVMYEGVLSEVGDRESVDEIGLRMAGGNPEVKS